jgi:hypothetical protein
MILAKEIDGELWVKASDHHRLIKDAQRTWQGLTDEEVDEWTPEIHTVIRAIEAKLKEKNT